MVSHFIKKTKCVCLIWIVFLLVAFIHLKTGFHEIANCGIDPFNPGQCFFDSHTHNYEYLIVEPNVCKSDNVFLLIAVPSAPNEFETRKVIRETWGSVVAEKNSTIRLVFMLGYSMSVDQKDIYEESRRYHDVIQENVIDTYQNLSIKSEAILRFTVTFCSNAKFTLKIDVDMFLNLPPLLDYLKQIKEARFVMGFLHHKASPIQEISSKWYTKDFPLSVYPDYLSGTAYVMSQSAILDLFMTSLRTKIFWLEDVYITGIVRKRASISLIPHPGFTIGKLPVDICSFTKFNQISAHRYSRFEIAKIWSQKIEGKPCPSPDFMESFAIFHRNVVLFLNTYIISFS